MHFQITKFGYYFAKLFPYIRITIAYTFIALAVGILLGLILTVLKLSRFRILRIFSTGISAVFRSIPPVVLLFLVYYGLPVIGKLFSANFLIGKSSFFYVTIAVSIIGSVQISEIMRSAYTSVNKGQYEAAVCAGLSSWSAFRRIMLPQAISYGLPGMSTVIINLTKEGTLGYTIGLIDMFGCAVSLNALTYGNYILEIYLSLTVIYWILMFMVVTGIHRLERNFRIEKV